MKRALLIWRKELLETLRDRRTIAVMFLLPALLYPLLAILVSEYAAGHAAKQTASVSRVAVRGGGGARASIEEAVRRGDRIRVVGAGARPDVVVEIPDDFTAALAAGRATELGVVYDKSDDAARLAEERVEAALEKHRASVVAGKLRALGQPRTLIEPFTIRQRSTAPPERVGGQMLGSVLPMAFVLMVVLGAFYPAIDLTAGEKERGTLETLLAAPVTAREIVWGKYLAVVSVAIVTGVVNLLSIGATFLGVFRDALAAADVLPAVPWRGLAAAALVVVPAAAFYSAVMLAVACMARGFRDAQNLLTPVYLAIVVPAMLAQLPGQRLTAATAIVPGISTGLLVRELVQGTAPAGLVALSLGATAVYTALALALAVRLFSGERMLFAPDVVRRSRARRDAATPGEAIATVAVVALLMIYLGDALQSWRFVPGMLATEWLLVLGPCVALAALAPLSRAAIGLSRPRARHLAGAALIGATAWIVAGALSEHLTDVPPREVEFMRSLLFPTPPRPLAVDLAVLAVSPAICEETLFRGVLLRATVPRVGAAWAIVLNGVLFGVFHLDLYRLLPTALLGTLLALVAVRTGSLLPGILLHALNNAAAVLVGRLIGPEAALGDTPTPWPLVAAAAGVTAVGVWLCARGGSRSAATG